jgi:hypothetical protein
MIMKLKSEKYSLFGTVRDKLRRTKWDFLYVYKRSNAVDQKVKLSRYTPWRRVVGEEVQLLLCLNLGTRRG